MTRSMQGIIKAVDEIACKDEPLFRRVLASHDLGYNDGYTQGKRHAYKIARRWAVGILLCGGIVAWVIG